MEYRKGLMVDRGNYELIEEIDEGGFGVVWKAYNKFLDRPVALKFFSKKTELLQKLGSDRNQDAVTLGRLSARSHPGHRYIVAAYHFYRGDVEVDPFLEMEWMEGGNLYDRIYRSDKSLDENEIRKIAMQLSLGLDCAHEEGIIHCDIKPQNVLLPKNLDTYKLTDFGLAFRDGSTSNLSGGTIPYMSPEQYRRERPSAESDVFSLGILIYECCEKTTPYRVLGDDRRYREMLQHGDPIRLPFRNPNISPGLQEVIRHCTNPERKRRLSIRDLQARLKEYGDSIGAVPELEAFFKHEDDESAQSTSRMASRRYIGHRSSGLIFAGDKTSQVLYPVSSIANMHASRFVMSPRNVEWKRLQANVNNHDGGYLESWSFDRPQDGKGHWPLTNVPYKFAEAFVEWIGGAAILPTVDELSAYFSLEDSPLKRQIDEYLKVEDLPFVQFWCRPEGDTNVDKAPMFRYPDRSNFSPFMSKVYRPTHYCFRHYTFVVFMGKTIWEKVEWDRTAFLEALAVIPESQRRFLIPSEERERLIASEARASKASKASGAALPPASPSCPADESMIIPGSSAESVSRKKDPMTEELAPGSILFDPDDDIGPENRDEENDDGPPPSALFPPS